MQEAAEEVEVFDGKLGGNVRCKEEVASTLKDVRYRVEKVAKILEFVNAAVDAPEGDGYALKDTKKLVAQALQDLRGRFFLLSRSECSERSEFVSTDAGASYF